MKSKEFTLETTRLNSEQRPLWLFAWLIEISIYFMMLERKVNIEFNNNVQWNGMEAQREEG